MKAGVRFIRRRTDIATVALFRVSRLGVGWTIQFLFPDTCCTLSLEAGCLRFLIFFL